MRWNLDAPVPARPGRMWLAIGLALGIFGFVFGVAMLFRHCGSEADARRLVRRGDVTGLIAALNANPALLSARDPTHRSTLLHLAVDVNQWDVATILLERGAEVDARDKYSMTPLHKAAIFNRVNLAKLLIEEHADLDVLAPKYGYILVSPLHLAAEVGAADMVDLLAESGANMNPQPASGPVNPSPLHLAAAKGQYAAAKALLDHGADPAARDRNGRTPEDWANEMQQPELAKLLQHAIQVRPNQDAP
jgi:ankyrin repeat protein